MARNRKAPRNASARIIPFRPKRRSPGRLRRSARALAGQFSPIMVMAPLAVFTAVLLWGGGPPSLARIFAPQPSASDPEAARFGQCWGRRGSDCVIDGDSLMYQGRQIRVADINAPELGQPGCERERELAERAKDRLQQLLNAGPFRLEAADRSRDRYGRELWVLTRDGRSLGDALVREGLAHEWQGWKRDWCGQG